MMTHERLAQILLANGVNSPAELEKVLRYVLVLRDRPLPLDCPAGGGGSNQEGAGDPGGALVPDFVGQRYKDTNTGNIWIANSTTPGDWTLEVQNMQMKWVPTSEKLGEKIGIGTDSNYGFSTLGNATEIDLEGDSLESGLAIYFANVLEYIKGLNVTSMDQGSIVIQNSDPIIQVLFPSLVSLGGEINISANAALTTINLSALLSISETLTIANNPNLTSVLLGSLATASKAIAISGNALLTTIDLTAFSPTNGKNLNFQSNALTAAMVNLVLAKCVANAGYISGNVALGAGTNAAPSGQGIADKATLIGRGVTVTTN